MSQTMVLVCAPEPSMVLVCAPYLYINLKNFLALVSDPLGLGMDGRTHRNVPHQLAESSAAGGGDGAAPGDRRGGPSGPAVDQSPPPIGVCVHRHPVLAARDENLWVEQAVTLGAEGFRIATRRWLELASDATGEGPEVNQIDEVSRVYASRTLDGWLRVDGLFAPQDEGLVEAVLDAGVDRALRDAQTVIPASPDSPCPPSARCGARRPRRAGHAPGAVRHVGPRPLSPRGRRPSRSADRARGGRLRRDRLPGRTRRPERGPRRRPADLAVAARHSPRHHGPRGGWVFPGCDRPPGWTDIHHCTPWSEGGGTSVENGARCSVGGITRSSTNTVGE